MKLQSRYILPSGLATVAWFAVAVAGQAGAALAKPRAAADAAPVARVADHSAQAARHWQAFAGAAAARASWEGLFAAQR